MRSHAAAIALFAFSALAPSAFPQGIIVTAEGHHGAVPPELSKDAVSVEINRHPARVESWIPLRGEHARLDLYILIDDGADTELGLQYGSLKAFIEAQPATTRIGLAYMRNGQANIAAPLDSDRAQFEKALRIPTAQPGIAASPYMCVSDLLKKWPSETARREVLLIGSGIDPWSPTDPQNPYLDKAIADAQRAGVLLHSIWFPEAGHFGHSYWPGNMGLTFLSELGDGTGGEAYWQPGPGIPVSIEPNLTDLARRLDNQYLLTVESPTGAGLEPIKVSAHQSGVSLQSASRMLIQPGESSRAKGNSGR
jgi:hypothetical protein